MIQKIIASIVMLAVLSPSIVNAYTPEDRLQAQEMVGEYAQYIPMLSDALPRVSDQKLIELQATLTTALSSDNSDIANFVRYALISVDLELQLRETLLPLQEISDEDRQAVEQEIMNLQGNLENEIAEILSSVIAGWTDNIHYEEKGNLNMSLDMAFEDFIEFEGNLDILKYISQTHMFDQTFTGDIKANYNTKVPGSYGGEVDFSMEANTDIIIKDGAAYIKLDNLSAQSQSSNEYFELDITPFTNKLKELADNNTYVEFPTEEAYLYLQSLVYSDMSKGMRAQIQEAFDAPLLEVDTKTENGYTLIPTKHFCDIGKKISGIFDPFAGKNCSERQYQDMLEDFAASDLAVQLTLGNTNTLSLSYAQQNESMNIALSWSSDTITSITGTFIDTTWSSYNGERHVDFTFIPQKSFSLTMGDNSFDASVNLLMDRNGKIYEGDYTLDVENIFISKGVYRNKNISVTLTGQNRDNTISCDFSGPMRTNFVDISGGCDIHSPEIEYQIPGVQDIRIDSELSYDGRGGSNNLDITVNTEINNNNYFDFRLTNKGTQRNIGEKIILAPERTKDSSEFFDEIYTELYSDYDYGLDYEYTSNEYDDYSEDCYIYESGDTTCYKYYDDRTETCDFTAETGETYCSEYVYDNWEYETKEYTFDDHTTTCYVYKNGNTTCYEYYEDRSVTCEYVVETSETNCSTYEYGYKLIETETDEYSQTCYNYDNGDYTCYTYYDDKDEACYYNAETDKLDCQTYDYNDYDYYNDYNYNNVENAEDAVED